MHHCEDCETATRITDSLLRYLDRLEEREPIGMDTRRERLALHKKVPQQGVYAFYEGSVAVYVGRSDGLSKRILQHGRMGESHKSTPVAARIAKGEGVDLPLAKGVVKAMKVRAVEIQCPNVQAIFEVYAHVALGQTRYNDFRNH